jgi:hypothetical protein
MSSKVNHLLNARQRIEAGWCQFTEAVDATGHPVDADTKEAVGFCAFGALVAALPITSIGEATRLLDLMAPFVPSKSQASKLGLGCDVVSYNDLPSTTKQDILALFDQTIAHQLAVEEA